MGFTLDSRVGHGAAGSATLLYDVDQDRVEHSQEHERQKDKHNSREIVEHLRGEMRKNGYFIWSLYEIPAVRVTCVSGD